MGLISWNVLGFLENPESIFYPLLRANLKEAENNGDNNHGGHFRKAFSVDP